MELAAPKSVRSNGRDAFLWTTTIGGVAYRIAWSKDDGKIRISWQDSSDWSRFVTLGPTWSPQSDLLAAQAAVESWVRHRTAAVAAQSAAR
jgi:hypothetical protein